VRATSAAVGVGSCEQALISSAAALAASA